LLAVPPLSLARSPERELLGSAVAESFFKNLKKERIKKHICKDPAFG
jgi:hypothetical protein